MEEQINIPMYATHAGTHVYIRIHICTTMHIHINRFNDQQQSVSRVKVGHLRQKPSHPQRPANAKN